MLLPSRCGSTVNLQAQDRLGPERSTYLCARAAKFAMRRASMRSITACGDQIWLRNTIFVGWWSHVQEFTSSFRFTRRFFGKKQRFFTTSPDADIPQKGEDREERGGSGGSAVPPRDLCSTLDFEGDMKGIERDTYWVLNGMMSFCWVMVDENGVKHQRFCGIWDIEQQCGIWGLSKHGRLQQKERPLNNWKTYVFNPEVLGQRLTVNNLLFQTNPRRYDVPHDKGNEHIAYLYLTEQHESFSDMVQTWCPFNPQVIGCFQSSCFAQYFN